MATPPHLEILSPGSSDDTALFNAFPRLPAELRLRIWELCLHRRRVFEVDVKLPRPHPNRSSRHPYSTRNSLGKVISSTGYKPIIHAWSPLHHPLLRVNHEARTAALAFYRIHLPCHIPRPVNLADTNNSPSQDQPEQEEEETVPSTLYFNPTWDILFFSFSHLTFDNGSDEGFGDGFQFEDQISLASQKYSSTICAMLHDMRAYDPLGVGVLNLGFDNDSLREFATELPRKEDEDEDICMERGYREVVRCLAGLKEVFWLAHKDGEVPEEGEGPKWRDWWKRMLEFYGIEYETPPREFVLRGTDLPEWEQELYRAMREREEAEQHVTV